MKLVLLALFASAILLLGCTGSAPAAPSQPSANGQQPPAGSNQQPANTAPPVNAPPAAASAAVEISGFAFSPSNLAVAKGTTVTWTNKDSVGHTVTSGSFDSGTVPNGGTFSFTFTQDGTYGYHCSIHPSMTGTITVTG